jgi:hypothetical protein
MISHEHKCIFVHIPRTAGTSIEVWLTGRDWHQSEPEAKHLLASQAKELYREYWDDYFKFSFVRHPITRVLSCLKYAQEFGLQRDGQDISFAEYHRLFGSDVVVEFDYRYQSQPPVRTARHVPRTVYQNILDEPLDFIGRYEDLADHTRLIQEQLGVLLPFQQYYEETPSKPPGYYDLSDKTLAHVKDLYARDYGQFGYL